MQSDWEFTRVIWMNVVRSQVAANSSAKLKNLTFDFTIRPLEAGHSPIGICILLLIHKSDTHFTFLWRIEGWVESFVHLVDNYSKRLCFHAVFCRCRVLWAILWKRFGRRHSSAFLVCGRRFRRRWLLWDVHVACCRAGLSAGQSTSVLLAAYLLWTGMHFFIKRVTLSNKLSDLVFVCLLL